jgi:hypothetical protein
MGSGRSPGSATIAAAMGYQYDPPTLHQVPDVYSRASDVIEGRCASPPLNRKAFGPDRRRAALPRCSACGGRWRLSLALPPVRRSAAQGWRVRGER